MPETTPSRLPPLVPRWRSVINALRLARDPIPLLLENVRLYGKTYAFHLGGLKKGVFSIEPEFIRHVLQKNHRNYRKSGLQTGLLRSYIGRGLLTAEGDYWLRQRRLIQPGFSRGRIDGVIGLMVEEVRSVYKDLEVEKCGGTVDIYKVMHNLTFRIIVRTIFSTGIPEAEMQSLGDSITRIQAMVVRQIRQPYLHWWFRLSGMIKRHLELATDTRRRILQLIRERVNSGETRDDLLQMLLDARYQDTGEGMTEDQILDECMILFVAGHETSANALSWAVYLLSQHPDMLARLRESCSILEKDGKLAMEKLSKMDVLSNVLNETMRLYPPAWVIDRVSVEEDNVCGFHLPEDTFLVLLIYGLHRDPDIWPDPDRFDPDRFSSGKTGSETGFSFLPFGAGPRLCIGNHFAFTEMQIALMKFVQAFDFTLIPGQRIVPLPLVTLRPKGGILVDLKKRRILAQ